MTSNKFSTDFITLSLEYFQCRLTPIQYRHLAVAIAREFIPPQFEIGGDNTVDLALGHSTAQARHRYAINEGDLPWLTHDAIWEYRSVCEQWWNICGVGPMDPPNPLRLAHTYQPSYRGLTPYRSSPPSQPSKDNIPSLNDNISELITAAVSRSFSIMQREMAEDFLPALIESSLDAYEKRTAARRNPRHPTLSWPSSLDSSTSRDSGSDINQGADHPPQLPTPSTWISISSDSIEMVTDSKGLPEDNNDELEYYDGPVNPPQASAPQSVIDLDDDSEDSEDDGDDDDEGEESDEEEDGEGEYRPRWSYDNRGGSRERGRDRKRRNKDTGEGSDGDRRRNTRATYDRPARNAALQTIRALCFTPSSPSPSHPKSSNIDVGEEKLRSLALDGIRSALQDQNARERSPEQLKAIMAAIALEEDFSVVLPTGGGKSMIWQATAFVETDGASVIMAPYKLLLEEHLENSRSMNIVSARYTSGSTPPSDYKNLFIQPETGKSEGFKK